MKFSVVIPTRNRLHLLRSAIETVRRQDKADWEIIVFDNASEDPIASYVSDLSDPRIKYDRSSEFLPVTESWNRGMSLVEGDYAILLGDDDGLTPGYFRRLEALITRFGGPDVIYTDFYQFWHAGVAPWQPAPHLLDVKHGFFFQDRNEPFVLSRDEAVRAVTGSLKLRMNFSFNSQAIMYRREFVEKLRQDGAFFRSPFPDYHIANKALAKSRHTVVVPQPIAVAGVSRASYGYAMYNDQEAKGDAFLNSTLDTDPVYVSVKSRLLPGRTYNTNYLLAMEYVSRETRQEIGVAPDYERYRRMQLLALLQARSAGALSNSFWRELRPKLSSVEIAWCCGISALIYARNRIPNFRVRTDKILNDISSVTSVGPSPKHYGPNTFENVVELYQAFETGQFDHSDA
jgi:glycosyltransferase involved in cell wall biosynthesis